MPHDYSSNIKSLVSMKDLKLVGLKSHDCHILMQQLLPVAIRGILPDKVRITITRLCLFFNDICSKVFDPSMLDDFQPRLLLYCAGWKCIFPHYFLILWFT